MPYGPLDVPGCGGPQPRDLPRSTIDLLQSKELP
jgi:hypothetical protein